MRRTSLLILLIAIPLGGCAVLSKSSNPDDSVQKRPAPEALIAGDFVNALSQLESLPALSTTVDLLQSDRTDTFTLAVQDALESAGYGSRWVSNQGSDTLFQYRRVAESAAASSSRKIYELAVGIVEMRRSYLTDAMQRVRPVSPLFVRGTDASAIVLNDEIFSQSHVMPDERTVADLNTSQQGRVDQKQAARVHAVPGTPAPLIRNTPAAPLGLQNASSLRVPSEANPLNPLVANTAGGQSISLPLIALPREENVFDLGGSNFDDVLSGHSALVEQVLTFANDSMRLGKRNKQLVEQLVMRFNPETDIFSVIGCSMGPTQVRGGNAALALGRAGRVVEALRFAGVADSHILDEGCWAGDGALESLPRRGVVITLNRQV